MTSLLNLIERVALKWKLRFIPYKKEEVDRLLSLLQDIPLSRPAIDIWQQETSALIESLVTSRVSSKDIASILAGLASYRMTGITPHRAHSSLVSAYCNTSGSWQDLLHRVLFSIPKQPELEEGIVSEYFGRVRKETIEQILHVLDEKGYCVLPFQLPDPFVQAIRSESRSFSYNVREPFNETVPKTISGIDPENPPKCVAAYANNTEVLASPLLMSLMNDPVISYIASRHMSATVTPIDGTLWYSFPSKSASSESAQLFHYDLDTLRWLKAFYYITDVTSESGPHTYIPGSHKPGTKNAHLLKRGYGRISDEEMEAAHPKQQVSLTGRAGTIILGDTRCYHKGMHLKTGHRLIFSPIYAPSRIGYFHGEAKKSE